jgi:hypothetical protein
MGYVTEFATNPPGTFSLLELPDGALDLVAVRFPFNAATLNLIPNKLIIRRAVNLTSGATIPVLDFSAGEAVNPASATLTLSGAGSDETSALVNFITSSGTTAALFVGTSVGASSTMYGVPPAQLASGDLHQVIAVARVGTSDDIRAVNKYVYNLSAMAIDLHPALSSPTVTSVATSPYARLRVQLPSQTDYSSGMTASFSQTAGVSERTASVFITSGYLGSTPATWDVTLPDLSAVTGFDANWGLRPSAATDWEVVGYGGPLGALLGAGRSDGMTLSFATRSGSQSTAARARQGIASTLSRTTPLVSRAWPMRHARTIIALPRR